MNKLIPSYYAEYGRSIDLYRAIPINIDGLKLVERRILWALSKINKKTKSVNAIGEAIKIHPHGDLALYGVMDQQVFQHRAIGYGSWGSLEKEGMTSPAAARYTSIQINNKMCKTSFEYINDVPYENFDFTLEPLYLADAIPLGLCGRNNIIGIGFHSTVIPRYNKADLAKRLYWLLTDNNKNIKFDQDGDLLDFGPCIKPAYNDCESMEETKYAYHEILMNGIGTLKLVPKGGIDENNIIHVQGKSSTHSFKPLLTYCSNNKIEVIENNQEDDPYFIDLELKVPKKIWVDHSIKKTFKFIWTKFLIKSVTYRCNFVDLENKIVNIHGIDQVLLNNYNYYTYTIFNHKCKEFERLNIEYFHNSIILIIKDIFNKHIIKTVDDILKHYNSKDVITLEKLDTTYIKYQRLITREDIDYVVGNNSIKKLINVQIDINKTTQKINKCKLDIQNIESDCFKLVRSYF